MTLSDASTEIRVAVLGEWVPSQLADVLALQRAEEPGTAVALVECPTAVSTDNSLRRGFDFALSTADLNWPGWVREPLWHDALAVAVGKRSHLLIYREMPCCELQKQTIICAQSATDEPRLAAARRLFDDMPRVHDRAVSSFDMAMTLVAAGYGISIAPAARLAGYQHRGIAVRPLADAPAIVLAYLLYPCVGLAEPQERFAHRARSVS